MEAYERLEVEWAQWNDLDPAGMVACSSGTAALHLALEALQLPQGSEIITGDFNMIAVPRAIVMAGLTPVFVDCDERLLMNTSLIPNGFQAGIFTHVYGRQIEITDTENTFYLIEDLAEAHGVRPHVCTDVACWSFYRNKIVAGEEGGAVWFKDTEHARLAKQLRSLGFTHHHDFQHIPRGHNYRMSNAHAALVLDSLTLVFSNLRQRREIELWYDETCPPAYRQPSRDVPWVYDIRIPGLYPGKQNKLVRELQDAGIAARHGFKPMSQQEEFKRCKRVLGGVNTFGEQHSLACIAAQEVIYLPVQPGVTTQESVKLSFDIIKKTLN